MSGNIELFSCGLYSTWCMWKPDNILFDCGEGVATHLKNRVYAIDEIYISHGHGDHILGLPSFVGIRNSARGDKQKSLRIYYPKDAYGILDIKNFILNRNPLLHYELTWIPLKNTVNHIPLVNKNRLIESFPVNHCKGSMGYNVLERRRRLKAEYQGQNIPELLRSGIKKEDITEEYYAKLLSYTLDSYSFDFSFIEKSELWIADSTFLKVSDRDKPTHMTYYEVVKNAFDKEVKKVVCAHISPRYTSKDIDSLQGNDKVMIKSPHGVLKI